MKFSDYLTIFALYGIVLAVALVLGGTASALGTSFNSATAWWWHDVFRMLNGGTGQ